MFIVDVKMFIIRLVVFFMVMGILVSLFVALGELDKTSGDARRLNELGESMLGSDFTIARGIFDPQKQVSIVGVGNRSFIDLNNSLIEPVSFCDALTCTEFLVFDTNTQKYSSAYEFGACGALSATATQRDWTVWMKTNSGVSPAIMRLTMGKDSNAGYFTALTCAIENAGRYKTVYKTGYVARQCGPSYVGCKVTYDNASGNICVEDFVPRCRHIGNVAVISRPLETGSRNIAIYPIQDVPNAVDTCTSPPDFTNTPTTFGTDKSKDVKEIILCDETKV